ncbi:hypothetical protein EPH_0016330 [Eimeria praecox]|uniref:Uncharacterized protein n=1 Tax=Eimeria praecox TaxID=51316 RepID=U6H195_9EIME|nr:hypothetical protein EPH_0016330 [Eimeria praecox]
MWEKPGGAVPPDPGLQERAGAEEQRAEGPLGIPGVSSLASFKPRGRHRWIHRWPVFLSLVLTLTALGVAHRKTKDTRLSSPRIHIETKPVYPDSRHQQQYPTKKPTAASPKKRYESSFAIAEAKEEAVQTRFKDSKEARGEVRDRPIPSEDWQLPLAEETDRSLRGKLARKLLAQITRECIDKSIEANETLLSEEEEELATAAAETLTQGESQELEGLEMRLVNVLPLGRAVQEQAFQGPVLTTRVLGSGISNNLFVEAVEPGKGYSVTLQLHMCVTGEEGNLSLEAANRWVDIAKETRNKHQKWR